MKSVIRYLVIILISVNISSGYEPHETSKFIDDIEIYLNLSESEEYDNSLKVLSATRAVTYIEAFNRTRQFCFLKQAGRLDLKNESVEEFTKALDEGLYDVYGYVIPDTATIPVICKVLSKYAEDNPAELTKFPLLFMDTAFKDAWGSSN